MAHSMLGTESTATAEDSKRLAGNETSSAAASDIIDDINYLFGDDPESTGLVNGSDAPKLNSSNHVDVKSLVTDIAPAVNTSKKKPLAENVVSESTKKNSESRRAHKTSSSSKKQYSGSSECDVHKKGASKRSVKDANVSSSNHSSDSKLKDSSVKSFSSSETGAKLGSTAVKPSSSAKTQASSGKSSSGSGGKHSSGKVSVQQSHKNRSDKETETKQDNKNYRMSDSVKSSIKSHHKTASGRSETRKDASGDKESPSTSETHHKKKSDTKQSSNEKASHSKQRDHNKASHSKVTNKNVTHSRGTIETPSSFSKQKTEYEKPSQSEVVVVTYSKQKLSVEKTSEHSKQNADLKKVSHLATSLSKSCLKSLKHSFFTDMNCNLEKHRSVFNSSSAVSEQCKPPVKKQKKVMFDLVGAITSQTNQLSKLPETTTGHTSMVDSRNLMLKVFSKPKLIIYVKYIVAP